MKKDSAIKTESSIMRPVLWNRVSIQLGPEFAPEFTPEFIFGERHLY